MRPGLAHGWVPGCGCGCARCAGVPVSSAMMVCNGLITAPPRRSSAARLRCSACWPSCTTSSHRARRGQRAVTVTVTVTMDDAASWRRGWLAVMHDHHGGPLRSMGNATPNDYARSSCPPALVRPGRPWSALVAVRDDQRRPAMVRNYPPSTSQPAPWCSSAPRASSLSARSSRPRHTRAPAFSVRSRSLAHRRASLGDALSTPPPTLRHVSRAQQAPTCLQASCEDCQYPSSRFP